MLPSVILSVGSDRGISARVDDEEDFEGREDRAEKDRIYLGMRGVIAVISRRLVEDVGKGRIGTEHDVVCCRTGSCGKGWIDCQAAPLKRAPWSTQGPTP